MLTQHQPPKKGSPQWQVLKFVKLGRVVWEFGTLWKIRGVDEYVYPATIKACLRKEWIAYKKAGSRDLRITRLGNQMLSGSQEKRK